MIGALLRLLRVELRMDASHESLLFRLGTRIADRARSKAWVLSIGFGGEMGVRATIRTADWGRVDVLDVMACMAAIPMRSVLDMRMPLARLRMRSPATTAKDRDGPCLDS